MPAGRPKNFDSPDILKIVWDEYKEDLKEQAKGWPKVQYVGKEGNRKEDYPVLPYTLEGFKRFCRNNYGDVAQYFKNQDKAYTEFLPICSHIVEEIREQQITGGMLGAFNPSITQRLNGLTDKQDITSAGEKIAQVIKWGDKEINV